MAEESLETLYVYLAQAYIRLQAEETLGMCLEAGETSPIQTMVEKLVLAGPISISAMREILSEAEVRRLQVDQELRRMIHDIEEDPGPLMNDLNLLRDIVGYLQDWLWGLIYLSARQGQLDESDYPARVKYLQ